MSVIPTATPYLDNTAAGEYFKTHKDAGDAWAQMSAVLSDFGLGSLSKVLEGGIIDGWNVNQAMENMRGTPEYRQRFAAIINRQKAGLPAMSESDVVNTERQYAQIMQEAGMPSGFFDQPEDFVDLLSKDVSPTEMQGRIIKGYQVAQTADPQTKAALQQMYGLGPGDFAAYFLDPQKTLDLLTKQVTAAQIAGTANRTGFGNLDTAQAESLSTLGVNQAQAQTGFADLAAKKELMTGLPGGAEGNISTDTQLAGTFGGDADATRLIKDRAAARVAAGQAGGGFTQTKEGNTGVGTAR